MRIGFDTRNFNKEASPGYRNYILQLLQHLIAQYPQHHFFAFTTDNNAITITEIKNLSIVLIKPAGLNLLSLKFWYDFKLSSALKRYQIDVIICTNGICSTTSKLPQVLIVTEFNFNPKTSSLNNKALGYYKNYTRSFLKKASSVATITQQLREEIADLKIIDVAGVAVTGFGASPNFQALQWEEKEAIKEEYTEGYEYFVVNNSLHLIGDLVTVLKAFSVFKKWQKSGLKLVIGAVNDDNLNEITKLLSNYKYRADVIVKTGLTEQEIARLIAASYAAICPIANSRIPFAVLEALNCEIPIITSTNISGEIAGSGAVYVDITKPEDIAEAMKTIYKDENYRNKLIENGKVQKGSLNWKTTVQTIMQLAEQAVSQ